MIRPHLRYRTLNPALNKNTFKNVSSSNSVALDQKMTIKGTVDKTAICLILLLIPAYYVFNSGSVGYAIPGAVIGFLLAIVTIGACLALQLKVSALNHFDESAHYLVIKLFLGLVLRL